MPIPELETLTLTRPQFVDGSGGMTDTKVQYSAGFTNRAHWHDCAHGMNEVDRVLMTSEDFFGPGGLMWFPRSRPKADIDF